MQTADLAGDARDVRAAMLGRQPMAHRQARPPLRIVDRPHAVAATVGPNGSIRPSPETR